jgi:hypothetical protein
MGHRDELDVERVEVDPPAQRHLADLDPIAEIHLAQLQAQERGGERRGVDRAAEPRPEVLDRAQMVLVGMGQHQADHVLAPVLDEVRVGQDDVDARRRLVAEGDAAVDDQPLAADAVEIEVHADFAGAAQGQEHQGVIGGRAGMGRGGRSL